jgi:hypothetical protein
MSLSTATRSAANAIRNNVATKTSAPASKATELFTWRFEPRPRSFNCTIFEATKDFARDASHPLHIKTRRRLTAFDPTILHWNVKAPLELSKKAIVRVWAIRRVKVAFREALKEGGWDANGRRLAGAGIELSGAVCMYLSKNKGIIKASGEDVKRECEGVLRLVVKRQSLPRNDGRAASVGSRTHLRIGRGSGEWTRRPPLSNPG